MMKRYLLSIILLISGTCIPNFTEAQTASSPNSNWNKLDARAQKYYSEKDAAKLSEVKIKQINFRYTKSFVFERSISGNCPDINVDEFDIQLYEHQRQQSKRKKVGTSESCQNIVLISIDELEDAYKRIANEK